MDPVRFGRAVRGLRRRRRWRQIDLAESCGLSQGAISLVERGHVDKLALATVQRICRSLDASVSYDLRWRGGALERLTDEAHAEVVVRALALLHLFGWVTEVEVSYSEYGERGSIDVLALHPGHQALLVVEIKTDLVSAEETLRKLDEKARLGPRIGRSRFGWHTKSVSRLLVFPISMTIRRRLAQHSRLFDSALPGRGHEVRRWLRDPSGSLRGISFVSVSNPRSGSHNGHVRERVRVSRRAPVGAQTTISEPLERRSASPNHN